MKTGGNKMKTKTAQALSTLCVSGVLSLGLATGQALADDNNPALKALFDQANYWHEKSHDDLAMSSLKKVLMVDANNAQALYLMALWSQQGGDTKAAAQWRARLAQASPGASQLQALDNARQVQQIPQGQLALARQQARSGNTTAALTTWRGMFNGDQPPAGLAPEYYLTMAGDKSLYPQALSNLRQLAAQNPQDNAARIALGKVLTYREESRREGIALLEEMASGNKDADSSLRQALLWLGPQSGDETHYQTWIQRHPQDSEVLAYYRKNVGGAAKGTGFNDLNSGNLAAARKQFEQVLQANPTDADALAGMGYVAQRQGDYAGAAQYLKRAADQGGTESSARQTQADDAAFYGQLSQAQQAYKQGNISQALALSAPLAAQSGERGMAAKLFRADVLRHNKDYPQSEQTLRDILSSDPSSESARENLYYVLRDQNKTDEAQAMLRSLPASLQAKLQPRVVTGTPADPVRRQAQQALAAGNTAQAVTILRQGIARIPDDPWLRLDLARILDKQGSSAEALSLMEPVSRPGAGNNALYAAALYASDQKAWQQVQTLLGRVSPAGRNKDMRDLAQRANFNLQMDTAERYLSQGNPTAAANTLKSIAGQAPDTPADAGKLARLLAQSGDMSSAVAVVRSSIAQGVKGNAGDYADQVTVLNQAGLSSEAQNLLANPELQARSTPTQLAGIRNGYVINEVDTLREQGNYAAAYDKLIRALQQDPQNTDLMFAMGRLYQSGKMNKEAGVVYDYLMTRDTPAQDARAGAIDVALANNDVAKARQLAAGLKNTGEPTRLLLLARVAEAEGNHQQALALLRTARGKLVGLQENGTSTSPMLGGLVLADNPFGGTARTVGNGSQSVYGAAMPWQVAQVARDPSSSVAGTTRTDLPAPTADSLTLRQVDTMLTQLDEKTATWTQGGVEMRSRDGDSGMSKLTDTRAPLQWSTVPFGDSRLDVNITPLSLDAGTTSGDNNRRFGTGALIQGQVAKANNLSSLAGDTLPSVDSQGSQNQSGVEVSTALTGDHYKLDLGTTPLGADLSTVVGGVQWSPQLTDYLKIIFTGERRAVTDSLLSYVGAFDKYSGKHWGQVTRNGGKVQLSYDDGDVGFFVGGGAWSYLGDNVASNNSVDGSAGFYVRPIRADDRELKTGININYMSYSKNLGYFSYGQGGYFSPQNYVSVSLPVDYSQTFSNLKLSVGAAVGYQSYSEDQSNYYPNDPDLQSQLEAYAAAGETPYTNYASKSQTGMGYNLHATADYKINKDMSVGGRLGYDTFGDYKESTARVWFRYMLGDH